MKLFLAIYSVAILSVAHGNPVPQVSSLATTTVSSVWDASPSSASIPSSVSTTTVSSGLGNPLPTTSDTFVYSGSPTSIISYTSSTSLPIISSSYYSEPSSISYPSGTPSSWEPASRTVWESAFISTLTTPSGVPRHLQTPIEFTYYPLPSFTGSISYPSGFDTFSAYSRPRTSTVSSPLSSFFASPSAA